MVAITYCRLLVFIRAPWRHGRFSRDCPSVNRRRGVCGLRIAKEQLYKLPPQAQRLYLMYPAPHTDTWTQETQLPLLHRIVKRLNVLPPASEDVHPTKLTDSVPAFREWNQALYLAPWALAPFLFRSYLYYMNPEYHIGSWTMWISLVLFSLTFGLHWVSFLNHLARKYGYFNGGVGRDTIPYSEVPKVVTEVVCGLVFRPAMVVFLTYDPAAPPSMTLWAPLQLFFFTLVEDFYYYWAHRVCHEGESLWKLHRQHHTTKAPTTLLLGYAGQLQEVFDIVGAPTLTWFTFPVPFDVFMTWMIIHISIQLHGHSGIRLWYGSILTGPYLRPFGMELISEDHDLHHRHGWRESYNYGKQSTVWDTIFGTKGERIEAHDGNLLWHHLVY